MKYEHLEEIVNECIREGYAETVPRVVLARKIAQRGKAESWFIKSTLKLMDEFDLVKPIGVGDTWSVKLHSIAEKTHEPERKTQTN